MGVARDDEPDTVGIAGHHRAGMRAPSPSCLGSPDRPESGGSGGPEDRLSRSTSRSRFFIEFRGNSAIQATQSGTACAGSPARVCSRSSSSATGGPGLEDDERDRCLEAVADRCSDDRRVRDRGVLQQYALDIAG
jgi:hypothetical protein